MGVQTGNQKLVFSSQSSMFSGRISFTPTGSMTINSINLADEGIYRCTPTAFSLDAPAVETNLVVYGKLNKYIHNLFIHSATQQFLKVACCLAVAPDVTVRKITDPLQAGSGEVQAAACTASNGKFLSTI